MSAAPGKPLELRASEQRERIHRSAVELILKVDETRERLSPAYNVREHFKAVLGAGALVAFAAGYVVAGAFTGDSSR